MGNDITIAGGIIIFFITIGVCLPFFNDEFGGYSDYTAINENNPNIIQNEEIHAIAGQRNDSERSFFEWFVPGWVSQGVSDSTSIFGIFFSILDIFFWGFGSLPLFLNCILFIPMRIILALIIVRNIWIGGGA